MMNAKLRLVCRVVGILLLATGAVKNMVDAIHSATFQRIPEFNGAVGSFHLSGSGTLAIAIGGLLIYFGFRAPSRPTQ
jgi:hypothetical protein